MTCSMKFHAKVSESRSVLFNSLPPQILRAKILEWVAFLSTGDLPNPGIEPRSPSLQVGSLPAELQGTQVEID